MVRRAPLPSRRRNRICRTHRAETDAADLPAKGSTEEEAAKGSMEEAAPEEHPENPPGLKEEPPKPVLVGDNHPPPRYNPLVVGFKSVTKS